MTCSSFKRVFGVAGKRRRPGAVNPVFVDDGLRHLLDFRIRRQAEIILGRKVEAAETDAVIVLRRADRQRRLVRRFRVRPQAVAAAQILPLIERIDAIEKVVAPQLPEVTHASGQGFDRIAVDYDIQHDVLPLIDRLRRWCLSV